MMFKFRVGKELTVHSGDEEMRLRHGQTRAVSRSSSVRLTNES